MQSYTQAIYFYRSFKQN